MIRAFSYRFDTDGNKFVYCSRSRCDNKLSVILENVEGISWKVPFVVDGYALTEVGVEFPRICCSLKCMSLVVQQLLRNGRE